MESYKRYLCDDDDDDDNIFIPKTTRYRLQINLNENSSGSEYSDVLSNEQVHVLANDYNDPHSFNQTPGIDTYNENDNLNDSSTTCNEQQIDTSDFSDDQESISSQEVSFENYFV
jgi:hypothetical protein